MPQPTIKEIAAWSYVQAFVKAHYVDALAAETKYDIPLLANMAQASLESDWGQSPIGNNYHGIKADDYWYRNGGKGYVTGTNEVVEGQTIRIRDAFRVYDSPAASFIDYAHVVKYGAAYAEGRAALPNLEGFIRGVAKKYATAPDYGDVVLYRARICLEALKLAGLVKLN